MLFMERLVKVSNESTKIEIKEEKGGNNMLFGSRHVLIVGSLVSTELRPGATGEPVVPPVTGSTKLW